MREQTRLGNAALYYGPLYIGMAHPQVANTAPHFEEVEKDSLPVWGWVWRVLNIVHKELAC